MNLSKTQSSTTVEERERTKVVPYALAIGSIRYVVLCTAMCLATCLARGSKSDPGVDHWTAVKNILKYLKRTKDMFLVYGGDKEFGVNGYDNASFNTYPNDSE